MFELKEYTKFIESHLDEIDTPLEPRDLYKTDINKDPSTIILTDKRIYQLGTVYSGYGIKEYRTTGRQIVDRS